MSEQESRLLVIGDFTADWNLARMRRVEEDGHTWHWESRACIAPSVGGAGLLAELLGVVQGRMLERGSGSWRVTTAEDAARVLSLEDPQQRFNRSFAIWAPFDRCPEADESEGPRLVWRVDNYLGIEHCDAVSAEMSANEMAPVQPLPDILVIDDGGLGFRDREHCWKPLLAEMNRAMKADRGYRPWTVVKLSRPVASGALWHYLLETHSDRLVVVTRVESLRETEVQISRALSWEKTTEDLAVELIYNPAVNSLSECAHVVVSFDTAGVVLMKRADSPENVPSLRLIFDPPVVEGSWVQQYPGGMIGYTSCLTAGICRQLMLNPEEPDIEGGAKQGLYAMRQLHTDGYFATEPDGTSMRGALVAPPAEREPHWRLEFPRQHIAEGLEQDTGGAIAEDDSEDRGRGKMLYASVAVRIPKRGKREKANGAAGAPRDLWTILGERHDDETKLHSLAYEIVLEGPDEAIKDVPIARLGKLLTVDRREIESLRSIRELAIDYCCRGPSNRPLSIAVFGAPGSGKSFAVREVATSMPEVDVESIEFNLSQFDDPRFLLDSFHQVRDRVLEGKLPLVFWDEFDTALRGQPLGWLRYFLAPMQDGTFREEQLEHPIGRAIFVFAGGTAASMADFAGLPGFSQLKGPDFVSRLKGYIDVMGPNPVERFGDDPQHVVRRAILLRNRLSMVAPNLFADRKGGGALRMDSGVLRAFLMIPKYKHGARSLAAIISMSTLAGKTRFERSCLPTVEQLELHVDSLRFQHLVQQFELTGDVIERLARANHEVYQEGAKAKGDTGPYVDTDYDDLPPDIKEDNRAAVRDIGVKLEAVGYYVRRAGRDAPSGRFTRDIVEMLAEMEHDRWMKSKIAAGYVYGETRDDDSDPRKHPALVPWREMTEEQLAERYTEAELQAIGRGVLSESYREYDLNLVENIPDILEKAGYAIAPVRKRPE